MSFSIKIGARSSPLSKAQIEEVRADLLSFHSHIVLDSILVETTGDLDQKTSLRNLGKTDFFTKQVDELLLTGQCRIAVHSAKDLPETLTPGLELICLTKGQDPSDSLVLREGQTMDSLPSGAIIATSSERRELAVKQLRSDLCFRDIRGTIGQRLAVLERGEADGVVIAEAALIRLGLTHLNRIKLPGPTVPFQGQLAITARHGDSEMRDLFACLNIS
ncbi:MAG: hydroxymethylbilane synthase [Chlamydiales bacterium]|nr:hydroxymethylbilane synthase [Chlamydiales bacterium]